MERIGREFREHIRATRKDNCVISQLDDDHISLATPAATGRVSFYPFDDAPEIVELSIADNDRPDDPTFFLHFELNDIERARELFAQMTEALEQQDRYDTTHVLLCCTAGMTTSMFAAKLTEAAKTLSLDYSFDAIPLNQAKEQGGSWDAVLLAPQVGYQRKEVSAAFPDAAVVEIPAKIFARYDAIGTLRMVMHLLSDHTFFPAPDAKDLTIMRDMKNDKRIMCVTCIKRPKSTWLGWRIYDDGVVVGSGNSVKLTHDIHDIEDLVATLPAQGFKVSDLDAIGIALPGVVSRGKVSSDGSTSFDYDLAHALYERHGVKVFIENNARAAAVGCYVSQDNYDSLVFHAQQTGFLVGGEGIVVDGHLTKGRKSFAGEIGPLTFAQLGTEPDSNACWTPEGMRNIVARCLAAGISFVAPDAVYVAVDLIDDMADLREELTRYFCGLEQFIPDLVKVYDYRERIALGMQALCLNKLHHPQPHRKH